MKKLFQVAWLLCLPCIAFAQLGGKVVDESTKEKIPGAVISVENSFLVTVSGADGSFLVPRLKGKSVQLKISHIGFETKIMEATLPDDKLEITLSPKTYLGDEVVVTATRASDKSPTAFSTVTKEELEKKNLGQDVPYLLNTTPSVVVTSDAGAGVGYTGIRIRGSDPTRVNVTINGIPLNDAEENGMYWVDLPDFASSVNSIQIQRGIGTSTNGAGAFGASINILSSTLSQQPFAEINSSYGSFNTLKSTFNFGTGLLKNKFAFEGRLSKIKSDGFVDRGASDLKSFYLSGGYYGSKSTLRAVVFSGKEKTYQAWSGVPEAKLKNDYDGLVTHYYNNLYYLYYTPDDSINLFTSGNRTYNGFTYKNQTDNYQQDYYQLFYTLSIGNHLNLNAALHYTKGNGYYEEYKHQQLFVNYGLENVGNSSWGTRETDLIRQKCLDNDFYGATISSNYETDKLQFIIGAAGNQYTGRHFNQIIWAQYASNGAKDFVYEDNDATKNDFNVFAKAIYSMTSRLHLFGDVQYRMVDYSFIGAGEHLENISENVRHNFFNPKAGATFDLNKENKIYASYAIGNKEPIRSDYVKRSQLSPPKPEQMQDAEVGYKFSGDRFHVNTNFYFMNYKDQLIMTGQINDVGDPVRINVDRSSRIGMELEIAWSVRKNISIYANLTYSKNKIKKFDEYISPLLKEHSNTDIAFSPSVISSAIVSWLPVKNLSFDFISKYVGKQYLDNTSDETRKLDPYFLNDVLLQYHFSLSCCKEIVLKLGVYNVFDQKYESNGYTYGYMYGTQEIRENFYFPQAGINWLGGITLKF